MKCSPRSAAATLFAAVCLLTAGCGPRQPFEGRFNGVVTRTAADGDAASMTEVWYLGGSESGGYDISRNRGEEACALKASPVGDEDILAFELEKSCVIEGSTLWLGTGAAAEQDGLAVSLTWKRADGTTAFSECGQLIRQ